MKIVNPEWSETDLSQSYSIYFQDETGGFKNMASSTVWQQIKICSLSGIQNEVQSGNGNRSIVTHVER